MAELILTQEEESAGSYLDWDAESIGKLIQWLARDLDTEGGKRELIVNMAAAMALIAKASKFEAETMTIQQHGLTRGGESIGDWEVIVRRIK